MSDAFEAVRRRVGPEVVRVLEHELSASELNTFLLSVLAARADNVVVSRLLSDNPWSAPARVDPRRLAAVEHAAWQALPEAFEGLALSPVAPLGSVAALTGTSQHRVLTTLRGSEVVSDATNVLAIEAARRRRAGADEAHMAACHRVLRTQRFHGKGLSQHFSLLSLVSSAQDTGSGRTEARLLVLHLQSLLDVAAAAGASNLRVQWAIFDASAVTERVRDVVVPAIGLPYEELPDHNGDGYYTSVRFKVLAGDTELGDGGLTTWTARLLSNAKERCLTSCISTERLAQPLM